jgi:hypothetical protein
LIVPWPWSDIPRTSNTVQEPHEHGGITGGWQGQGPARFFFFFFFNNLGFLSLKIENLKFWPSL